jgi:hypothetical protein
MFLPCYGLVPSTMDGRYKESSRGNLRVDLQHQVNGADAKLNEAVGQRCKNGAISMFNVRARLASASDSSLFRPHLALNEILESCTRG